MITKTIGNTGADYTSISAAVASVSANPSDDHTFNVITATNVQSSGTTLSIANSNNRTFLLTVATGVSWVDLGGPKASIITSSARAAGTGNPYLLIMGTGWTVERLAFDMTGTSGIRVDTTATLRKLIIRNDGSNFSSGISVNQSGVKTVTVSDCVAWGFGSSGGITCEHTDATVNVYHCSLLTGGNSGFYRTAGTMNTYACVASGSSGFSGTIGGDENVSTDTSAPGTTNWRSQSGLYVSTTASSEDLHSNKASGTYTVTNRSGTIADLATDCDGCARNSNEAIDAGCDQVHSTLTVGNTGADYTSIGAAVDAMPANPGNNYTIKVITATNVQSTAYTLAKANSQNKSFLITVAAGLSWVDLGGPKASVISSSARWSCLADVQPLIVTGSGWTVERLVFDVSGTSSGLSRMLYVTGAVAVSFRKLLLRCSSGNAVEAAGASGCVVTCSDIAVWGHSVGFYINAANAVMKVYHASVYGSQNYRRDSGTFETYACIAMGGGGADFQGTNGGNENVSSDTTAPGATNWRSQTGVYVSTTASSEDLHCAKAHGTFTVTDRSGTIADLATDCDGQTRTAPWDAGCDQIPPVSYVFSRDRTVMRTHLRR